MRLYRKCPQCYRDCGKDVKAKTLVDTCPNCGISLKNQVWYIDYYVEGIRKREVISNNKRLAETVMAQRLVQIKEQKYFDIRKEQYHSLKEIAEEFLNYSVVNKQRAVFRKEIIVRHLMEFFGNIKLHQITPNQIEKYKWKRLNDDQRKPATVNRELAGLKTIFNLAIRNQKVTTNPMRAVKLLKEDNVKLRILSDEEKDILLKCCTKSMKRIVLFALTTGLRRSEILNLRWKDVDYAYGMINICHTKGGKDRIIHLNPFIERILKECYNFTDSIYVFCNEQKQQYRSINSLFQNIVKKTKLEHFSFHTLRHTAASDMLDMGVDIVTVKEILGHSDLKVTLRYAHSKEANKIAAIDKLCARVDTKWTPSDFNRIEIVSPVKKNTFILQSDIVSTEGWPSG